MKSNWKGLSSEIKNQTGSGRNQSGQSIQSFRLFIDQSLTIPVITIFMPRVMRAPAIIVIVVIMPSRSANFSVATRIERGHARQQNNVKSQNNFFHFNLPQIRPTPVSVVFCSLFRVQVKQGRCQLMDSENSRLKADKFFLADSPLSKRYFDFSFWFGS